MKNLIFFLLLAALMPSTSYAGNDEEYKETLQTLPQLIYANPDSAILVANRLLPGVYAMGDFKSVSTLLRLTGGAYENQNKFEPALNYFLKTLAIDNLRKDSSSVALDYALIGVIQMDLLRYQQARVSLNTSYKIYSSLSDFKRMGDVMMNIAISYGEDTISGDRKVAKQCLDKTEQLYIAGGAIDHYAGSIDYNKAYLYAQTKQFDSSWYYYDKTLGFFSRKKHLIDFDSMVLMNSYVGIAELHFEEGNYTNSEKYFGYVLDNNFYKEPSLIMECYSYLHKVKARTGDSASAYKYLLEYSRYSDSSARTQMSTNLSKMEVTYRVKQKEDEIAQLEQLNYIKMLQHKQDGLVIYITLGCLVFVVIVAFFIFKLYNSKIRLNKDLTLANEEISRKIREKELLMVEIHHRVKNNLQFVSSMLNIKSREVNIASFKDATEDINLRIQSMALVHQHLYESSDISRIDLSKNLAHLLNTLSSTYESNVPVKIDYQLEPVFTKPDVAVPLGLILTELVSNSMKYAFAGKQDGLISVSLKRIGKVHILNVSDNGTGIQKDNRDTSLGGLGLKLTRLLTRQINADLSIESDRTGTKFSLSFEPKMAPGEKHEGRT